MSDDPDEPLEPRIVAGTASAGGTSTATAQAVILRWPPITPGTLAVGVVLGVIGACLKIWCIFSGLGDNLLAVTVGIFVVWIMEQLRKWLILRSWGRKVLRIIGLKQQEVPS
jgi:hypothetical protein